MGASRAFIATILIGIVATASASAATSTDTTHVVPKFNPRVQSVNPGVRLLMQKGAAFLPKRYEDLSSHPALKFSVLDTLTGDARQLLQGTEESTSETSNGTFTGTGANPGTGGSDTGTGSGCPAGKVPCDNGCMPADAVCCNDGSGACPATQTCVPGTNKCCSADQKVCGQGCIKLNDVCCNDGTNAYCPAGSVCEPGTNRCPFGTFPPPSSTGVTNSPPSKGTPGGNGGTGSTVTCGSKQKACDGGCIDQDAVCCNDGSGSCPKDYTCIVNSSKCQKSASTATKAGMGIIMALLGVASLLSVLV